MNTIKIFLVISNGLLALLATLIFFLKYKIRLWDWLMINTCTPSVATFIYAALTGNKIVMGIASALMLFYGVLSLFIFSWQGKHIFPQIGHLFMIAGASYILLEIVREGEFISFLIGAVIGIIIIIPLGIYQIRYFRTHQEVIEKLKDPKFERIILGK